MDVQGGIAKQALAAGLAHEGNPQAAQMPEGEMPPEEENTAEMQ